MKKTVTTLFAGAAVVASTFIPFIPQEQELLFSYQYDPAEYQEFIQEGPNLAVQKNPFPNIGVDDDGNGIVSISVFKSSKNDEYVFVQIPDAKYSDMGRVDGYSKNPKKSEFKSIIDEVTRPKVANAAIALDAFVDVQICVSCSSLTYAHTVAGTERLIVVDSIITSDASLSSITYNGSALTNIASVSDDAGRVHTLRRLVAPSTGSNNVVITASVSASSIRGTSASYTGVDQTSPVGNSGSNSGTTNPMNVDLVTTVADSWGVASFRSSDGTQGNGTLTLRAVANSLGYADTNAGLGAPTTEAINFTHLGVSSAYIVAAIIQPAASAPAVAPFLAPIIIIE